MKRIVIAIAIVLSSIVHLYGYHSAEISFGRGGFRTSNFEYSSHNKCVDYSSSSYSSDSSSFRNGMRRGKSFNSQDLYQASSNHDMDSVKQEVPIFERQLQSGELVYVGNDSDAISVLCALHHSSLMQRDLPEFHRQRDFLNNQVAAINRTLNMPFTFKQEHGVTQEIREFFKQYNYDACVLDKPFFGTYLQFYLYKQCLSVFDTLAHAQLAHSSCILQPMDSIVADLAWAALSYNVVGHVKTASQLIQSCLMLLDCTSAVAYKSISTLSVIGDGALQVACHVGCGAQQGVDNVIVVLCDPVQFLTNCTQAIKITADGMLHATALGSQFSATTQMAISDSDNALATIEEIKKQVEPVMRSIDASIDHVAHMPAGKIIEGATAAVVEGVVWGAVGKLCRSTLKTIPVVAHAIKDGIAVGEIAITAEGIPVRISASKIVECMEVANAGTKNVAVKVEKAAEHAVVVAKMRGKRSHSYQKISTSTQVRPLDRLKGKDLIGIKGVTVRGYGALPKAIVLDNYAHYLQPELRLKKNGRLDPSGWHHDPGRKIQRIQRVNGHKIEIEKYKKHISGIYKFDWGVEGMDKKTSTFFPCVWSREIVQGKIVEAYKYARKYNFITEVEIKGNFALTGFTQEGISIKIIIKPDGTVVTAYPVFPK